MKRQFLIAWHIMRLNHYWNKCKRALDNSGKSHGMLLASNYSYRQASERYQESRDFLVEQGEYRTASSIIANIRYLKAPYSNISNLI